MSEPAPAPSPPPTSGREVGTALGLLYGGTGLLLVLSLAVPAVVSLQQAVLAVMLLMIPSVVLKRFAAPLTIDDLGVGLGPWTRTLGTSLATMLVVFSIFGVGFHVWNVQVRGAKADFSPTRLLRWGEDLERVPSQICAKHLADTKVRVWFDRGGLWVMGPAGRQLAVAIRSAPASVKVGRALRCPSGALPATGPLVTPNEGIFFPHKGFGLWVPLPDQQALSVAFRVDDQPVTEGQLVTGQYERSAALERNANEGDAQVLQAQLSLWWILTYLIVHLGLVALPEEWFFRGYLQPRLDHRFGTPVRILGADLGWGVVLSAAAFALLHPILVPGIHRLAVFFPALLFGWLRARTGNIGAAVVVHAGANLLQACLSRFYV